MSDSQPSPGGPNDLGVPFGNIFSHLQGLFGVDAMFSPVDKDEDSRESDCKLTKNKPAIVEAIMAHLHRCEEIMMGDVESLRRQIGTLVDSIHRTGVENDGTARFLLPTERLLALQGNVTRFVEILLLLVAGIEIPKHESEVATTPPEPISNPRLPSSQHGGGLTGFDVLDDALEKIAGGTSFRSIVFACPHKDIVKYFLICLGEITKKRHQVNNGTGDNPGYERAFLMRSIKQAVSMRMEARQGQNNPKQNTPRGGRGYQAPEVHDDGRRWDYELRKLERICASTGISKVIVVDFDNLSTTFALQNFKKSRIAYRYISALILATQNHHCVLFYTETTPQRVHTYFENPIAVDGRTEENISNPRVLLFDNDQANAPNLIHFQPTQAQYDKWRQIQTRLLLEMAYQNLHEDLGELWLSTLRRNSMPFLNELAWILSFRSGTVIHFIDCLDGHPSELKKLGTILGNDGTRWSEKLLEYLSGSEKNRNLGINIGENFRQKAWEQFCLAIHGQIDANHNDTNMYGGLAAGKLQVDDIGSTHAAFNLKLRFEYMLGKLVRQERTGLLEIVQKFNISVWSEEEMKTFHDQTMTEKDKEFFNDFSLAKFLFETSIVPAMPAKEM